MQNLDKKQLDRGHGIECTLPPPIGGATTGRQDGLGLKLASPVLLKLFDDLGESRRYRDLLSASVSDAPFIPESVTEDKREKWQHG
jgi:hypothetical protein